MRRLAALIPLALFALAGAASADEPRAVPDELQLRVMTARFAPVELGADLSRLPEGERRALALMIEASRVLDALYLRQAWAGNEALLLELVADRSPLGQVRLHAFLVNRGPWSQLDEQAPFLPGVPPRPAGANFYPAGASKEEVEPWLNSLPAAEREAATGFFTTIRRAPAGGFVAVPYSLEYQGELARAAELLRAAAAATAQPTLRAYLEKRADAFLSNDYYASDVAWMELDASIEPTIGPYETYDDGWFGYKAAFESFVGLRDEAETAKLSRFSSELQWLEDRLPIEPRYRNPKLGALAPIRVIDLVFSAGQANAGVQTAAFNLPNDDRVVAEKGSKRVMLKNTQRAKFEQVLVPISRVALAAADQADVDFDAFFTHILMHELLHGLGPGNIEVAGRRTTVRLELKDTYGAIEEAKADIAGLWALQQLVDKGALDRRFERTMYTTFLASAFRSIRFGIDEAHGKGQILQLNHLLDAGAVRVAADGTFAVVPEKVKAAVTALTAEILTLQAEGSHANAKALLDRLAVVRPEVQRVLDRLKDVPVDIEPSFTAAEALARR
jgi:hypothetical protein